MSHRCIQRIINGRIRPDIGGGLLWSSDGSPWSGFLLERKHGRRIFPSHRSYWPTSRVVLVTAGEIRVEDSAQTPRRFTTGLDSVTIWPAGHESASLSYSGDGEAIDLELDAGTLARLAPDERLGEVQLTLRQGIRDPQLSGLLRAMAREVEGGCSTGSLYGEALSLALAVYLSRWHSSGVASSKPIRGGLSRHQLTRVLEYIRSNLGCDLSLAGLAEVAQLSSWHFGRAFRTSLGVSPHQFVLAERIREARRLLERRSPIVEVALQLGFASQSHFTDCFHRATGVTPKHYQEVH
jgi:AraC family transcriptional regulator